MKGEQLFRQMSLFALLWIFNGKDVLKLTEAKTLAKWKSDYQKDGVPPIIIVHPKNRTVKEGRGLALNCAATGKPKPRIRWKKNGLTITKDEDKRIRIKPTGRGSKLRIRNAVFQDGGEYHCVAKSRLGLQTSIKARVEVQRKNETCGRCQPFRGTICSKYISDIFFPNFKPQKQSDENISIAAAILTDFMRPSCKRSFVKVLCYSLFPPCQPGKCPRPQLLCKDQCEVLRARTCSKEFRLLKTRLGAVADEIIPNCSKLASFHPDCIRVPVGQSHDCPIAKDSDVGQVTMKAFKESFSVCSDSGAHSKINIHKYDNGIFKLLKNVWSEILHGTTMLTSPSGEQSTYCFSASLPFNKLVRDWNFYRKTALLPNLQRPQHITVPGLKISILSSRVVGVLVPLGTAAKYKVHEKIVLKNVEFFYRYQFGNGTFIAKGEFSLCQTVFKLTVETLADGTVKLSGSSESPIDVSTIETAFISARPSNWLLKVFKKIDLFVLRLMRPYMEAYINKDFMVKFSGATYFGANAVPASLEIFGGKLRGNDLLLAGITSSNLTMTQILKMMTGFTIPHFDFLKASSNRSSVGIALSTNNVNISNTPYGGLQQQPLSLALAGTVPVGLSLITTAQIPKETHNDSQIYRLLQNVFGRESEFTVKATTTDGWQELMLDWYFHNVSKETITSFDRVKMKMKVVGLPLGFAPIEFAADGGLYSNEQPSKTLPFSGRLSLQNYKGYLEGNFQTHSEWRKALGIEFLTMKNLRIGVSLPINQSLHSKIRGEADLMLGSNCNNSDNDSIKQRCVTGHLFLGFSDDSRGHFFYGTLSPVSLQKLLELCNIQHKLPGAMATIGFPEGLQISVAKGAHDLRKLGGPVLQPGFIMKGKMSVMGIETTGAISLSPKEFEIDAKLTSDKTSTAVDDFTSLLLPRLNHERSRKLWLEARMKPVPYVKAQVDGYARLFGIFEDTRMLVTHDSLQIYLTTDVSKSFKINVDIITNYSSNRNDTLFNAMVVFDKGLTKLTHLAAKQVVAMLEQEMSELNSAKGEVQRKRRECIQTVKRDCSSCMKNRECASSLETCRTSVGKKTPANNRRGKRNPIDICQRFVMEVCLATEVACHNVCSFLGSNANKTCATYNAAATSQRKLERGLKWVKQAERSMDGNLFHIHGISFKTNVSSVVDFEHLYMDTSLEVTIFGQRQRLEGLRIGFNDFVKLSSEIATHAWDWYQTAKPQSKSKSLHLDNRPRPPSS